MLVEGWLKNRRVFPRRAPIPPPPPLKRRSGARRDFRWAGQARVQGRGRSSDLATGKRTCVTAAAITAGVVGGRNEPRGASTAPMKGRVRIRDLHVIHSEIYFSRGTRSAIGTIDFCRESPEKHRNSVETLAPQGFPGEWSQFRGPKRAQSLFSSIFFICFFIVKYRLSPLGPLNCVLKTIRSNIVLRVGHGSNNSPADLRGQ